MRRRTLLTGVSVGVTGLASGCSGDGDVQRQVSLVSQAKPDIRNLEIETELFEDTITTEHTAELQVRMTNRGSRRAFLIRDNYMCNVFNRQHGASDPPGLWLYRLERGENIDRDGQRWRPHPSESEPGPFDGAACGTVSYDSGESVSSTYGVWDDPREEGYLPSDTYRWRREIRVWSDPDSRRTHPADALVSHEFAISIE